MLCLRFLCLIVNHSTLLCDLFFLSKLALKLRMKRHVALMITV